MYRMIKLIELDFILITRNRILAVAAFITLLYILIIQVLPEASFTVVLTLLILSDPVMLGFMFTGAMVLFEKSSNTFQALSVTPVSAGEYLISKGITLTAVALAASLIMAIAGLRLNFNFAFLAAGVVLSSLLFIFIGFTGASRVRTFNQYFIIIPMFMIPTCLPFLNYFGATDALVFYLVPTQASLILFQAAFEGTAAVKTADIIYACLYLPLSVLVAYRVAEKAYTRMLTS
jgi:fluoroquinolone transport system permease protein